VDFDNNQHQKSPTFETLRLKKHAPSPSKNKQSAAQNAHQQTPKIAPQANT